MEKLEKILEMWQSDSVIDQTEPGRELVRIPSLHSKYLNILTNHRIASKRAHFEYMKMRKIKLEYFSGKLSKDELEKYGWEQFPFTLKAEINTYMEADLDLIKFLEKKSYHDEAISVVEAIMNELKQRTWQLRSFIDYEKFINGQ
jgi:hypothetical protein